jgi:hypothetical protein
VVFHRRAQVTELNPQPYTQHPTLDPKPLNVIHTPYTLHPTP